MGVTYGKVVSGIFMVWKRISVMVFKTSAYPNCSGRFITATEDL